MNEGDRELEHSEICLSQIDRQIMNLIEEGYAIEDVRRSLSWLLHELCCE